MNLSDLEQYFFIYRMEETTEALRVRGKNAMSELAKLEYYYACYEIEEFIVTHNQSEKLSEDTIQDLIALINKRWNRINNTDIAYGPSTTNPANQLYMQIAQDLQKSVGIHYNHILMPTPVDKKNDENEIFKQIYEDKNAWHVLVFGELSLFSIMEEISSENEKYFTEMILDCEFNLNSFKQQVNNFIQLEYMIKELNESEKLNFLTQSKMLDILLTRKTTKAVKINGLVEFLKGYSDQKAVLNLIDLDILSSYKNDKKIAKILEKQAAPIRTVQPIIIDLVSDDEIIFSDTESGDMNFEVEDFQEKEPEKEVEKEPEIELQIAIEIEPEIEKEPVQELEKEPEIQFEKMVIDFSPAINFNEMTEPDQNFIPTKFGPEDQVFFEEEKEQLEVATKKRKIVVDEINNLTETTVTSTQSITFFAKRKLPAPRPAQQEANKYVENLIKAKDWNEKQYPLEALHYVDKALKALEEHTYTEKWKSTCHNTLRGLVTDLMQTMLTDNVKINSRIQRYTENQKDLYEYSHQAIESINYLFANQESTKLFYLQAIEALKKLCTSSHRPKH